MTIKISSDYEDYQTNKSFGCLPMYWGDFFYRAKTLGKIQG